MAEPHQITITVKSDQKLTEIAINDITTEICKLMKASLDSQLERFKQDLGRASAGVVVDTTDDIIKKMHENFIHAFNAKLDEFSAEVAESDFSQDLTSKLIADLGVKFRDAIEGGFDNPSIEYYAKFIKYMEGLKNDKLGITEVDEAIKAVDDAINATKAPTEKATEAATEKAKNAAKNATEKAKKEAGNDAIPEVESAAKAVETAAAVDLKELKEKLDALNKALKELKEKLEKTSGGQRKTIKNKTIKNKTKKKKQVKPKTKPKPKPKTKTKPKPKTKRKHT